MRDLSKLTLDELEALYKETGRAFLHCDAYYGSDAIETAWALEDLEEISKEIKSRKKYSSVDYDEVENVYYYYVVGEDGNEVLDSVYEVGW